MSGYLIYPHRELTAATDTKLRRIAEAYGIDPAGKRRAALREEILHAPQNLSPIPHPLIKLPVED